MAWYSQLSKSFPQLVMIHTVKGFSVVDETEVDVFLEFPSFLYDPVDVGNLISGSSSFSKASLDIWKFLVHIMLKPNMQSFKHDLTSMGDECNCLMVNSLVLFLLPILGIGMRIHYKTGVIKKEKPSIITTVPFLGLLLKDILTLKMHEGHNISCVAHKVCFRLNNENLEVLRFLKVLTSS